MQTSVRKQQISPQLQLKVFQNAVALENSRAYVSYPGYDGSANKVPDITISISGNKVSL
jgi:hypothetical protein